MQWFDRYSVIHSSFLLPVTTIRWHIIELFRRLGWPRLNISLTSFLHMCAAIVESQHILAKRWSGCRSLVHAVPDEMPEMVTDATCTFAIGASRSSATSPHISAVSGLSPWAQPRSFLFSIAMQSQSVKARVESHYQASCSGCTQRIPHIFKANLAARPRQISPHIADRERRRHSRVYKNVAKQVGPRQHSPVPAMLNKLLGVQLKVSSNVVHCGFNSSLDTPNRDTS